MKPLFLRKMSVWYSIIITGILLIAIGLFQMAVSLGGHKSGTEGVPLSPAAGIEKSMEKENRSVGLESGFEQSAVKSRTGAKESGKGQMIGDARQNDFFIEYRLERDRTRSQQVDWLREIVNNQNSPEKSKNEAQQRLLGITNTIETEMKLETLLKAENFKDAVVVTDQNSVTIIVQVPILTQIDRNKIIELTARITGFDEQHIKIIRKA